MTKLLVKRRPLEKIFSLPTQTKVKAPEEEAPTMKVLEEEAPTMKVQEEEEEAHTMKILEEEEDSIIKNMVEVVVEAKEEGITIKINNILGDLKMLLTTRIGKSEDMTQVKCKRCLRIGHVAEDCRTRNENFPQHKQNFNSKSHSKSNTSTSAQYADNKDDDYEYVLTANQQVGFCKTQLPSTNK
jgi:hypothetical protein